ncbi:DNA methyltransferase [Zavarzinia sp. CC-PAN008]|uniref:DNA methyltransferase n=1 Tax=Zavarzinia sp. CC-PAN008 TaxID=3243332 RepID=UPI003F744C27
METAVSRLSKVNWDFTVRHAQHEVESVHPYPAKFIADLPGAFLDALTVAPDTLVMDPFCGSGTTLAEAQRRGHSTIGIDLNPIACLIARVKTAPHCRTMLSSAALVLERLMEKRTVRVPAIPNLDHWFKNPIQLALARLMDAIESMPEADRDFLRLAASSIVVRVSNQESDTRYAAIDKPITATDVGAGFRRACDKLYDALSARQYDLVPASVVEGNLLNLDLSQYIGRVGIIITSPPYPNAYEYWLYHKYRMWWLGYNPISVKQDEIGARAHFFKKNRHTASTFVDQMNQAFTQFEPLLVPGGWVCFVVGRSVIHGETIDNARIVEDVAVKHGLELVYHGTRKVLDSRKSFNLAHANIKRESIIVMRKAVS